MAEEQKTQEGQQAEAAAPAKKKKVNKLDVQSINSKIKELEDKNQATSRYYKHLLQRKKEAEGL